MHWHVAAAAVACCGFVVLQQSTSAKKHAVALAAALMAKQVKVPLHLIHTQLEKHLRFVPHQGSGASVKITEKSMKVINEGIVGFARGKYLWCASL